MTPIQKVLIANRGEVAVRIIRACRELGIRTVAVYSEADADSLAVRMAEQAVLLGAPPPTESYLRGDKLIAAALDTGCDAVHPGFGFLSENADFAEAVQQAGLVFIGPPAAAIRAMGLKTTALDLAQRAQVPIVPGYHDAGSDAQYRQAAEQIGYPVLVKAAAGGGGKGMRIVRAASELDAALESARREALKSFADERVFLEKYIEHARHIEFQIFADSHGHTLHLGERDCSVQRRHQKIIEESPSPAMTPELRAQMGMAAVRLAEAVGYVNAGTVEFIVDERDHRFYFLEMNTRLQVEHPVTEFVTGLDLVHLQFHVAAGGSLPFTQDQVTQRGHAIECRVYAEDPANQFLPAIGKLLRVEEPHAPNVRIDSGVVSGDSITIYYDPMIAKVIVYGTNRAQAIQRMQAALSQYLVMGVTTNIPFLRDVLDHPQFAQGQATTAMIEREFAAWQPPSITPPDAVLIAAALSSLFATTATVTSGNRSADEDAYNPWARTDGFRLGA
jgi:acetyl-CoA carboxylase biotin carboxylase subunit